MSCSTSRSLEYPNTMGRIQAIAVAATSSCLLISSPAHDVSAFAPSPVTSHTTTRSISSTGSRHCSLHLLHVRVPVVRLHAESDGSSETSVVEAPDKSSSSSFFSKSLFDSLPNFSGSGTQSTRPTAALETKDERVRRLKQERLVELAEGEVRRADRVREDALPYLGLLVLQILPLLGTERMYSVTYFFGLAVATVYLGGRQETIDAPERVTRQNALAAPIGASVSIGLIYILIKAGLDPTYLYALAVSLFGALAVSDVGVPILRNLLPASFAEAEVAVPEKVADRLDLDPPTLPVDGLTTLALGLAATAIYWSPAIALESKYLVSNALAWALAMTSLGAISLGSVQTGVILLAGLFFYDITFVFGTDIMMTVATKVEAPVKFLYTAPPSDTPRDYPFSVLGLGDVVVPGLFVRFMTRLDEVLKPQALSYFTATTAAYAAGLAVCFTVNEITHAGQPALLYLDPACVGAALACGAANGQVEDVWNFEEEENQKEEKKV